MKLQVAFNSTNLDHAIEVALSISNQVEMLEIGSLLLNKHGVVAIQKFRAALPQSTIVVDTKIAEFGKDSATLILQAGADWITVLAGTNKNVIHSACAAAHEIGGKVILDLIDAASPGQSALEAKSYGADAILFHQPHDSSERSILIDDWGMVKGNTNLPIYISAHIDRNNINEIIAMDPYGICIGKTISETSDPVAEVEFFKGLLE